MSDIWTIVATSLRSGFDATAILYALGAALALLLVMRLAGLMHRNAKWHQALVCVYYLYIPLVFVGAAVAWSVVGTAEKSTRAAIVEAKPAISQVSSEYAGSAWKVLLGKLGKNPGMSLRDASLAVARDYTDKLLETVPGASAVGLFLKPLISSMQEGFAGALASKLEEEITENASATLKVDKNLLLALWRVDISAALQGGLVADILAGQVGNAFKPLYSQIRTGVILLLLPVVLETLISVWRRRKAAGK